MRFLVTAAALASGLALAACNPSDQQKTQADTQAAAQNVKQGATAVGNDVETSAKDAGTDIKKIANDPDVKKAQGELKTALKDLGASVKDAARKEKHERHDDADRGGNDNG